MVPDVMGMYLPDHRAPLCLADKQSLLKPDTIFSCEFKNCGQMLLLGKHTHTHTQTPHKSNNLSWLFQELFFSRFCVAYLSKSVNMRVLICVEPEAQERDY